MKKSLMKLFALVFVLLVLSSTGVAFALNASWSGETTVTTPKKGGIVFNNSTHSTKATNDLKGTVYTVEQSTLLTHQIALTYANYKNDKVIGSDWATAKANKTEYPYLNVTTYGLTFWSAAKSHDSEWTDNTTVKYKFSSDEM